MDFSFEKAGDFQEFIQWLKYFGRHEKGGDLKINIKRRNLFRWFHTGVTFNSLYLFNVEKEMVFYKVRNILVGKVNDLKYPWPGPLWVDS